MRINNNMLAINTHRQLGGVALMQAKSMEKLSSGFRINRAGDDAAGLAISEKMRAQIRGLHTAAKNAQDGISLIQTAEGALQEVHAMLNRMVELATQSANGTFDDAVDRKNLESEVIALKDEIDRVAKSANFNGIKLLDGSLGDAAAAGKLRNVTVNGVTEAVAVTEADAAAGTFTMEGVFKAAVNKNTTKTSIKYNDAGGQEHRIDVEFSGDNNTQQNVVIKLDGKEIKTINNKDLSDLTKTEKLFKDELSALSEFKDLFVVEDGAANTDGKLVFKTQVKGETKAAVTEILVGQKATDQIEDLELESINLTVKASRNVKTTVDTEKMKALGKADLSQDAVNKAVIIVDGEKFVAVQKGSLTDLELLKVLKENGISQQNIIVDDNEDSDKESVQRMVNRINEVFGKDTAYADGRKIVFEVKGAKGSTKGLTLQVGDTNDSFQKLTVSVGDMSSRGLNIGSVSVAEQEIAVKSIAKIKEAINSVSSARGDMGALQNRLEHTIANINTTAENITASESRIRDVDMAKEMVELTKANILQQAAQAMLAQANQAPQGVLQLLR